MKKKTQTKRKVSSSRSLKIPKNNGKTKLLVRIVSVILIVILGFLIGSLFTKNQVEELCTDTCDKDLCSQKDFLACSLGEDGCMNLLNKGLVVGQCNVKCLSDSQCKFNEICKNNVCVISSSSTQDETKCGNKDPDFGETCSSCPLDIVCQSEYSCINAQCKPIGLFADQNLDGKSVAGKCGYLNGQVSVTNKYASENIAWQSVSFYNSCSSPYSAESDASKLYDKRMGNEKEIWECYDSTGILFPQFASIKLDKEYVINRAKVSQNSIGAEALNVRDYALYVSIDSTNGADGHWIKVAQSLLPDGYLKIDEVFFDPVSAKWVRIEVNSMYHTPQKAFGIGELQVYEAPFICQTDTGHVA